MNKTLKISLIKLGLIIAVIFLDQLTKHLFYNTYCVLIPGLIGFRPSNLNTGGAWSILSNKMWLLIIVSIIFVVLAIVFDFKYKNTSKVYMISFGFIIGGTIGNLIDRLFLGGVRDFIYFDFYINYPTFNLADTFLLIGLTLFVVFIIFIYKPKGNQEKQK